MVIEFDAAILRPRRFVIALDGRPLGAVTDRSDLRFQRPLQQQRTAYRLRAALADRYPGSRKLPDALLKAGYCQYELRQWDKARAILTEVASKFADTPAGRLAQQRLEKLEAEGH